MKNIALVILATVALILSGCASGDASKESKTNQSNAKNPEVGMTKDQVVGLYGKTDNQNMSSDGETWIYNLNMGQAFIPFNFGYRPKTRITSKANGKTIAANISIAKTYWFLLVRVKASP